MKPTRESIESSRCAFLHGLCLEIAAGIAAGKTLTAAVQHARRRRSLRLFPRRGRLSRHRLTALFYLWKQHPAPQTFRRRYLPGRPRLPVALAVEFLNRLESSGRILPATAAMQSLRDDWAQGVALPGIGNWQQYELRRHGESARRTKATAFPFSLRTFYRTLASVQGRNYRTRSRRALQAQRELASFSEYLTALRTALEARTAHVPQSPRFAAQT